MTGTRAAISPNRSSGSVIPRRPATAHRWMIALVDPPTAASTVIARSNPAGVSSEDGRVPAATIETIRRPADSARSSAAASPDSNTAAPGSVIPSASAMIAMVEAVPIVLHAPSRAKARLEPRPVGVRHPPGPPLVVHPPQGRAAAEPDAVEAAGRLNPPVTISAGRSALASAIR